MKIHADMVFIGGGIASLWPACFFKARGYRVLVVESTALGNGQTICSQGIIHGGTKYTLNAKLSDSAQSISDMPKTWANALAGHSSVDLSQTKVLSDHQYLWSSGGLGSRLSTFFASKSMQSKVTTLAQSEWPEVFRHPQFKGQVYQLNETVLDVPSLLQNLRSNLRGSLIHWDQELAWAHRDNRWQLQLGQAQLSAQHYFLTAGKSNQSILQQLGWNRPKMQTRPLRMTLVKGSTLPSLYAHCIGPSTVPRITITTHPHSDGDQIWYIGGQPAEKGVDLSEVQNEEFIIKELSALFPWRNWDAVQIKSFLIDRAEGTQSDGSRPSGTSVETIENISVIWPTKLTLAPLLTTEIEKLKLRAECSNPTIEIPDALQEPKIAQSPWERSQLWN